MAALLSKEVTTVKILRYADRLDLYEYFPNERTAKHIKIYLMDMEFFGHTISLDLYMNGKPIPNKFGPWVPDTSFDVMDKYTTEPD